MAVWQYDLIVVPKSSLIEISVTDRLDKRMLESYDFWHGQYSTKDFKSFDKILPLGKSWSNEIIQYGEEGSHTLKLIAEDDSIVEVLLRIDFSKDYRAVLEEVLEYSLMNGMELIDQDLEVVKGNIHHLINKIESSPQFMAFEKLSG
ncbi:hypothetical protein [Roseivirga sp.]|uniref:hypothetical protein n=1 Tax=Roseivirga sp. TaxID=1964215 RepID=UPI003B52D6F1